MEVTSKMLGELPVVGNESFVDKDGNPAQIADIREDRIECHPSMVEKVREGIQGFANLSKGAVEDEDDHGESIP